MKTTYRKIAESQDIFRKLSEIPLNIADAERLKQGILELDKFYGEIDELRSEFLREPLPSRTKEEFEKDFNDFLNKEIELKKFPLDLSGESIIITALDLIRLGNLVNFKGL